MTYRVTLYMSCSLLMEGMTAFYSNQGLSGVSLWFRNFLVENQVENDGCLSLRADNLASLFHGVLLALHDCCACRPFAFPGPCDCRWTYLYIVTFSLLLMPNCGYESMVMLMA